MGDDQAIVVETVRQAIERSKRIRDLESLLDDLREQRGIDARYLALKTTCSRTLIAAALGISRVTLDKYLREGGITTGYQRAFHRHALLKGATLYDQRDMEIALSEAGL